MALLGQRDIEEAFAQLGALAHAAQEEVVLVLVGGAAMVFGYQARLSTHDVDAIFLPPPEAHRIRTWAQRVARDREWPEDWLNDGAKGFLNGLRLGPMVFQRPGILVYQACTEQLLALKLSAWRDDTDIADAICLLQALDTQQPVERLWQEVQPFIVRGRELKAYYAFLDVWESLYGIA